MLRTLTEPLGDAARLALLAGGFLLSGAASLMDQVVWLRLLSLTFGNTTLAAATLLAVFMGGLGLGAWWLGRRCDAWRRPLLVYAAFEAAIGAIAIASPHLIGWIDLAYVQVYRAWGSHAVLFSLGRAVLAAAVLLPPTLLMGGTLPLILRATARRPGEVGRTSALFYGINTAGAVLGTAFAGFLSIRTLGLTGTLALAAGANLLAALIAARLSPAFEAPAVAVRAATRATAPARWLIALFFLMGATSLAYEVLWTRILVFHLGASVYAYSLMLLLVLVGIAAGSLLATPWADRVGSVLTALALVELGIAAWMPFEILLFQHLAEVLAGFGTALGPTTFFARAGVQVLAVLPLLGPPTLLMGASFPLALRALHGSGGGVGADTGRVYGANTLGAVAGSLLAGFVLIPWVGTQNALLVTAAVNALLGFELARRAARPVPRWIGLGLLPALAVAALLLPPDRVILSAAHFAGDAVDDLAYFHEDAQASVTIRRREKDGWPYHALELNGVAVAGTSPELYAAQKMQGHLPLLLAGDVESVAHIGFGTGGTAWAVSRHTVGDILIVEISPEVLKASDTYFRGINHGVLEDPRVEVEVNDGRNFLLATPRRFDAILSDSIHPAYAGNGSLYSSEYFRLLAARLKDGGTASMWLPMYSLTPRNYAMILAAFRQVFPHVAVWYEASTVNAFTIVTGRRERPGWDRGALARAFSRPEVREELADVGVSRPAELVPLLLATTHELDPWLAEIAPHTDDLPVVEYESGTLLDRNAPWLEIFSRLLELRPETPPEAFVAALSAPEQEAARRLYRLHGARLRAHRDFLAAEIERLRR